MSVKNWEVLKERKKCQRVKFNERFMTSPEAMKVLGDEGLVEVLQALRELSARPQGMPYILEFTNKTTGVVVAVWNMLNEHIYEEPNYPNEFLEKSDLFQITLKKNYKRSLRKRASIIQGFKKLVGAYFEIKIRTE